MKRWSLRFVLLLSMSSQPGVLGALGTSWCSKEGGGAVDTARERSRRPGPDNECAATDRKGGRGVYTNRGMYGDR